MPTEASKMDEPNSGALTMFKNLYNHVLDMYISVLSSISSHILHQLFYDVIIPIISSEQLASNEEKKEAEIINS